MRKPDGRKRPPGLSSRRNAISATEPLLWNIEEEDADGVSSKPWDCLLAHGVDREHRPAWVEIGRSVAYVWHNGITRPPTKYLLPGWLGRITDWVDLQERVVRRHARKLVADNGGRFEAVLLPIPKAKGRTKKSKTAPYSNKVKGRRRSAIPGRFFLENVK